MPSPARSARSAKRRLLPLATGLFLAAFAGLATAWAAGASASSEQYLVTQATTTSSAEPAGQTTDLFTPTSETVEQGAQLGQTAVVPPAADQAPLNPGWETSQFEVRVLPEFDERAVLVILRFSLPADAQLPATLKLPVPTGASITGIGEIDPNGQYKYNYTDSYPQVQPGTEWDVASIEVKDYRELQVDYYYDPGLPAAAGKRSFPLLVQLPVDAGSLILHVQQPARATDFQVEPAPQGVGEAGDGFTYAVASFSDVKAGSTLAYLISYDNPDGGLSVEAGGPNSTGSSPAKVNTNTVLLAAILVVVVCIGAFVVYRSLSSSRRAGGTRGRSGAPRGSGARSAPSTAKGQRLAGKGSRAATPASGASRAAAKTRAGRSTDVAARTAPTADREGGTAEYCVACGEELDAKSRFCPNCGEARP